MKKKFIPMLIAAGIVMSSCGNNSQSTPTKTTDHPSTVESIYFQDVDGQLEIRKTMKTPEVKDFNYFVEEFADLGIMRYRVPEIENLSLKQQELLYYLQMAAQCGRDILYDQNGRYNLAIRSVLEGIYTNPSTDKTTDDFKALEVYLKRVWFSNGIHHHYAGDKFVPTFSKEYFITQYNALTEDFLPKYSNNPQLLNALVQEIFDPTIDVKRTNQEAGVDLIKTSAGNYYDEEITQVEAEAFYNKMKSDDAGNKAPISYGLNSRLEKNNGIVEENVYKVDGLYGEALKNVVFWLKKAELVAETPLQTKCIQNLIAYNTSGDLELFNEYCINWLKDTDAQIDFVNGFIETYGDPLGMKASWESIINFKDEIATKRSATVSANADWFEQNSPTDKQFKKEEVKGVTAKVITAAMLGGDCYPSTPIGINLPNANWIRAEYGSKSVSIDNLTEAYAEASKGNGFYEEFVCDAQTIQILNQYKKQMDDLHTDLHECLGHGSGKLLPGVDPDALKAYGSTIEEARADIFGLYFVADHKMQEIGLCPNDSAYKAMYYSYFMNGLMTQLTRVELGKNVEEAHMRNRQLIARWVLERCDESKAIEMIKRDNKTYVIINDYHEVRRLCGVLLAELQRIKSTGDYVAAQKLVEDYAVKVDINLHKEVLERNTKLNIKSFKGFVNPKYIGHFNESGEFTGLTIDYTEGYAEQHLRYSNEFGFLVH